MYTLTLDATNGAPANGVATNTVTATLLHDGTYVSNAALDFRIISGSALFLNGKQQTAAKTTVLGEAVVEFTDTEGEDVSILVIMGSDASVYQSVNSSFDAGGEGSYTLLLMATNTALANGTDTNTAKATLLKDGKPADGEALNFLMVRGSALFTDGMNTTSGITDIQGQAIVSFTDTIAETITLAALLQGDETVNQSINSAFTSVPDLSVTRVYNANDRVFDMSTGGPHNLFKGAAFYIELNEKSSSTLWECYDDNVNVENVNGIGHVQINDTPSSNIIRIKFSNASAKGEYDIDCNLYLNNIHAGILEGEWPSENQYLKIFDEWGDMTTFGWGIYYCFNQNPVFIQSYESVNMSSGDTDYVTRDRTNFATIGVLHSEKI